MHSVLKSKIRKGIIVVDVYLSQSIIQSINMFISTIIFLMVHRIYNLKYLLCCVDVAALI